MNGAEFLMYTISCLTVGAKVLAEIELLNLLLPILRGLLNLKDYQDTTKIFLAVAVPLIFV